MFDRVGRWFDRWGGWAVLVARPVPGVGWMISMPAGLARMRWIPLAGGWLPLVIAAIFVGGLVWWVRRRRRAAANGGHEES